MSESDFERVAPLEDFCEGVPVSLQLRTGEQVCMVRVRGEIFGIAEDCPHREFPMSDGEMVDDYIIECPMHGSQFDVRDGSAVEPLDEEPIQTYEVGVIDGYVRVRALQG